MPALQGCIVVAAGAAGAGAGYQLSGERGISQTIDDSTIHALVNKAWSDYNPQLAEDLDNTVFQGRVLLTGVVPSAEWRAEAVKRAWQVKDVKEVYDEIQVGPEQGFFNDLGDARISTELRAALVADADVRSINFTVTTVNRIVYIIGSARSQAEEDAVIDDARNIADVRRVVSYIRIRPGEPPAPAAAPAPPSGGGPAPAPYAPAPYAPPGAPVPASPAPPNAPPPPISATPDSAPTPRQSIEVTPLR